MNNPSYISFPFFDKFPEILCAFSTRNGGFSQNIYSSLNMGLNTGDDRDIILKNRHSFFENLGINAKHIAFQGQIHSANVKSVSKGGNYQNTDALFTTVSGIFLSVQTADCIPIFIYSPDQHAIAVIHAGWRGALSGVLKNSLTLFESDKKDNLKNLYVAFGPALQKTCFEIKEDVYSKVPEKFLLIHKEENRRYLDLQSCLKTQLTENGVVSENIFINKTCTHCDSERFYSYRRDRNNSGRMMGIIGLIK